MSEGWITYFLNICAVVAQKSKDPSTKVGCVIVNGHNAILSTGYNGLPRNVMEQPARYERPAKYRWTEHAERNAIYNAARHGISLDGTTLFVTGLPPCADCARAIIQCGIKEVCVCVPADSSASARWADETEISRIMFQEAGVAMMFTTQQQQKEGN